MYRSTKNNFLVGDALTIFPETTESKFTDNQENPQLRLGGLDEPSKRLNDGSRSARFPSRFDVVVGNPPYSSDQAARGTAYLPFVRVMWEATTASGTAGMVVPLSIAYTPPPLTRGSAKK